MTKKAKRKPGSNPDVEIKVKKTKTDFAIRSISAVFLFFFMAIYVGVAAIYTETSLAHKEIAGWFNLGFSTIIVGFAMYELTRMLDVGNKQEWYLIALSIFLGEVLFLFPIDGGIYLPLISATDLSWLKWYVIMIFVVVMILAIFLLGYLTTGLPKTGGLLLIYTFLIALGFKGFSLLALSPYYGINTILFVWFTIILTDSFAYLGGRKFGKHKMAPTVSPKKTWEGAGIGSATAIVVLTVYGSLFFYLLPSFSPFKVNLSNLENSWIGLPGLMLFLLAVLISVTGQLGDLLFSLLKRICDKKDFSNLIPGHGGVLDRFDSFILVFTVLYFISIVSGR